MNPFMQDIDDDFAEVFLDTEDFAVIAVIDGESVPALLTQESDTVLDDGVGELVPCLRVRRLPSGTPSTILVDGIVYRALRTEETRPGLTVIYLSKETRPRF